MRIKNLPRQLHMWNGQEWTTLELEHAKNVVDYDFKLGNLLFNAIKSEKKANQDLAGIQF